MKKGYAYTVLYMVLLAALLSFGLAIAYEAFKPRISGQRQLAEQRAVLYVFGLETGLDDEAVRARFGEQIREGNLGGLPCYLLVRDGAAGGYAFPFEGAGLWGAIRGYLGVDETLRRTTGLVFTAQNETPGLGGRIDEETFKAQFRGLPISPGAPLKYGRQADYELDAVTGATQTSSAVLRTLNRLVERITQEGEVARHDGKTL